MANSVMEKYLKSAQDVWEEAKHHRSDDGRFASGTGRGQAKGNGEEDGKGKSGKGEKKGSGERKEMSEDKATRIVRRAFEEAKCELKGLKLVQHHLRADVKEADEGSLEAINDYLTKRGLKAQIQDKTSYKIAEDGFDDIQVVDDPMLEVLVDLCIIDMLSKDLHYRAQGKPFYGIHELADLVHDIADDADDLNEVYYMGEKQEDPPERAFVAAKAAELVGKPGEMDDLLKALYAACEGAANAVENGKAKGVSGGTSAVLDDISKKSLQAKGLLMRTMKNSEGSKAIDALIAKGIYFKPEAAATDSGTSEGAKKGWETRHNGGKPWDENVIDLTREFRVSDWENERNGRFRFKNIGSLNDLEGGLWSHLDQIESISKDGNDWIVQMRVPTDADRSEREKDKIGRYKDVVKKNNAAGEIGKAKGFKHQGIVSSENTSYFSLQDTPILDQILSESTKEAGFDPTHEKREAIRWRKTGLLADKLAKELKSKGFDAKVGSVPGGFNGVWLTV